MALAKRCKPWASRANQRSAPPPSRSVLRPGTCPSNYPFATPAADPSDPLGHPANAAIVARLREQATERPDGRYEDHAHPDLAVWLDELAEGLWAKVAWFFGLPT